MRYPVTDHCDGRIFYNLDRSTQVGKTFVDVVRWKLAGGAATWPKWVDNTHVPALPDRVEPGEAFVTCVNHATQLIQLPGLTVLTDPVFSRRASPVRWAGPKRVRPPGLPIAGLPRLDAVVVSHNHYDHLDTASLVALAGRDDPWVIVPLGNKVLLAAHGVTKVVELDWWDAHSLGDGRRITLVPAQHWSARGVADRCETLWGGYVVAAGGVQVFFAGDTGYGGHFTMVRERLGPMDVSLLPIGAYAPRWFMRPQHMNPDDAVMAHRDLGSRHSLGMHFGTFQLTDEAIDAPPRELAARAAERGLAPDAFVPLYNGQTWRLPPPR